MDIKTKPIRMKLIRLNDGIKSNGKAIINAIDSKPPWTAASR
jgi:hypothetical protein